MATPPATTLPTKLPSTVPVPPPRKMSTLPNRQSFTSQYYGGTGRGKEDHTRDELSLEDYQIPVGSLEEQFIRMRGVEERDEPEDGDMFWARVSEVNKLWGNVEDVLTAEDDRRRARAGSHLRFLGQEHIRPRSGTNSSNTTGSSGGGGGGAGVVAGGGGGGSSGRSGGSTPRGFGDEVVTVAKLRMMEQHREQLPIEEIIRQEKDAEQQAEQEEVKRKEEEASRLARNKAKVDRWGFVIAEGEVDSRKGDPKKEGEMSKKEMEKESIKAEKWAKILLQWDGLSDEQKRKKKTQFRKGIPDRIRGAMWKKTAGVDEFKQDHIGMFNNLLGKLSEHDEQIQRDITRTFPKHVFFRDKDGMGQKSLFQTLKAYAVYEPQVGYCQGMGFIGALFLLYMAPEDAFILLVRLCSDYEMRGLFEPGFPLMHKFFYIHDGLIDQCLPRVAQHFKNEMIPTSMYATQWYNSLFTCSLPFSTVVRLWDIFFAEGLHMAFRIALAILKLNQADLIKLPFEEIGKRLKDMQDLNVNTEELIKVALEFNISKKIDKLERDWSSM
eukprot:TRINITY_DN2332_c1_g2_i1.p1 TRINITY_DN2332_c1_g2~~TRINITY_DN2332_c1_g2_i1.p1  ORF type:complete len:552 (+),score=153.89 TRINITY_DN2332_c1_g2_i1:307-1962(+)